MSLWRRLVGRRPGTHRDPAATGTRRVDLWRCPSCSAPVPYPDAERHLREAHGVGRERR